MRLWGLLGIVATIVFAFVLLLWTFSGTPNLPFGNPPFDRELPAYAMGLDFAGIALAFGFFMLVLGWRLIRGAEVPNDARDATLLDDL